MERLLIHVLGDRWQLDQVRGMGCGEFVQCFPFIPTIILLKEGLNLK